MRREEALRKLAKVEQDMLRLNDSLAIYKQQMDALESAVRKARQHQKLQDDLKRLEIASLLHGFRKRRPIGNHPSPAGSEAQRLTELREDVSTRRNRFPNRAAR